MSEGTSAARLREILSRHGEARAMLVSDAMYHAQIRYTCDLLDVVDEVADPETAKRITDAIGDRLAGPEASDAIKRAVEAAAEIGALSRSCRPPR
jgi:hypothetical protein